MEYMYNYLFWNYKFFVLFLWFVFLKKNIMVYFNWFWLLCFEFLLEVLFILLRVDCNLFMVLVRWFCNWELVNYVCVDVVLIFICDVFLEMDFFLWFLVRFIKMVDEIESCCCFVLFIMNMDCKSYKWWMVEIKFS